MDFFPYQWNMNKITNRGESYTLAVQPDAVKVALIDSGIDVSHPDLQQAILFDESRNFVGEVDDLSDTAGHGTMVAGMIAANGALKGVAPHASLVVCKMTDTAEFTVSKVIEAIEHATSVRVDVINLSLSTFKPLAAEAKDQLAIAIEKAVSAGILIVGSAGNEDVDLRQAEDKHIPGAFPGVTLVAATNLSGEKSSYSNYGAVTYSAPGGEWITPGSDKDCIVTTCPLAFEETRLIRENMGLPPGYGPTCGTSLAAAHMTGVAAVLIGQLKALTGKRPSLELVHAYLQKGCDRHEDVLGLGYGEVNAGRTLEALARDRMLFVTGK